MEELPKHSLSILRHPDPVPVRCATQQKARIAFLVDLQRLLAALGL
jgi:hypothetical protein